MNVRLSGEEAVAAIAVSDTARRAGSQGEAALATRRLAYAFGLKSSDALFMQ
jgi:hypothetical protein